MAGYNDTKALIINALMGRPVGTEIQPENQQAYELNMLDYIHSLELISTSTLIGIAEETTTPVQSNESRICYIAGVAQNQTVTFSNFIGSDGNPISVTTGDMEGVFVILLWNTQYWVAYTFATNIISSSQNATFYYNYNIKKTYASVALMNADVTSPIGTDGKSIKIGDLVTVVNSTTPAENGFYNYKGATNGWQLQSGFNFQVEQARSQNINTAPSSKLFDDQLNAQQVEINKEKAFRENAGNNIVYDPYFKYDIMLSTVDPQIVPFGAGTTVSLVNGEAIGKSSITTAKGMQIMARFSQGWATKYGLKAGDTIKVGAYIKAVVGSGANVTNYGTYGRNDLPASQITYTFNRIYLPLTSYTDWQWVENTLTLKTDGTDINQATDISLAYLQVTDPNASTTPTELHIKQPCILFNPPASATGFFESKRAQTIDYLYSNNASIPLIINSLTVLGDLTVNGILTLSNLIFNGGQVESTFLSVITEQMKTRWIALSDNQCFPTVGAFLGLKNGTDLVLCINGVETKLN